MTPEQEAKIWNVEDAFRAYGYVVDASPIPGSEDQFVSGLWEALKKVEEMMAFNARNFGMRVNSKRAMRALHAALPNPAWGVELAR